MDELQSSIEVIDLTGGRFKVDNHSSTRYLQGGGSLEMDRQEGPGWFLISAISDDQLIADN